MGQPKKEYIWITIVVAGILLLVAGFAKQQTSSSDVSKSNPWPVTTVPIQLGRDVYGLAMIDSKAQTVWIYELGMRGNSFERLRLVAARSFEYDRQLTEWNTGTPTPGQVEEILETLQKQANERARKQEEKIEELQDALDQ